MKKLLITILSISANVTLGQNIVVRDNSTREPITDVLIRDQDNHTVLTNNRGTANLETLNKNGKLELSHLAYNYLVINDSNKVIPTEINMIARQVILDEIVLSVNRQEEHKIDVPYSIAVIKQKEIEFANQPNSADLLQNTGAVFVQKSQLGGGSPILRGFEANKVQIVVDGVKMNNAIYRGGHLQDVITLDPNMLERTEIIFGPSSTIYGSDALGGVMHFYTKNAQFSQDSNLLVKANAMIRYASVNNENTAHVDVNIGGKRFATLTNISVSDFGDLMSGTSKLTGSPNSWDRVYYSQRISNRDTMILNGNNNLQIGSAYKQNDFMQRFNLKTGQHGLHALNLQYSQSSNIPRYDRLTEMAGKTLRFAEWNYGPQTRLMASYAFNYDKKNIFSDNIKLIAAYQKIDQDRISRRFQSATRTTQMEDITVMSLNLDAAKRIKEKHELRYGAELQLNDVKSSAKSTNILTNVEGPAATRYGDNGNSMNTIGVYVSHALEMNPNFVITDGLRYTHNNLVSNFKDTTFYKFPYTAAKQNNQAITWNLGFTWKETNNYKVSLLANTGFRTPNIDDMSKVTENANKIIIVPNASIKPEYATNLELGLSKVLAGNYKFDFTGFYTNIENVLVQADYTYNGLDTLVIGGVKNKVQAMQNKNKAYIYGFSAGMQLDFNKNLSLKSIINYTYGRYTDAKKDTVFALDHVPPVFGQTSLIYKEKNCDAEFFVRYNGRKIKTDYSNSGEDNAQYSADPVNGYTPAWFTLNLRVAYNFTDNFRLNFSFENITDNRYRVFASGINAPGKNLIIGLRYKM